MRKCIISFLIVLLTTMTAFSQCVTDSCIDMKLQGCLRQHPWLPHQFFEITPGDNMYITAYNGIDESLLFKKDSLKNDARRIVNEMIQALKIKFNLDAMSFVVYYFDKKSHLLGRSRFFNLLVQKGQITSIEETPLRYEAKSFAQLEANTRRQLHRVRLTEAQYLAPLYLDHDNLKDHDATGNVILVNLENSLTKKDRGAESQKQYTHLSKELLPSTSLGCIVIRYQDRFSREKIDYPFYISKLK